MRPCRLGKAQPVPRRSRACRFSVVLRLKPTITDISSEQAAERHKAGTDPPPRLQQRRQSRNLHRREDDDEAKAGPNCQPMKTPIAAPEDGAKQRTADDGLNLQSKLGFYYEPKSATEDKPQ